LQTSIYPDLSRLFPSTVASEATEEMGSITGGIHFCLNGDLRWGIELLTRGTCGQCWKVYSSSSTGPLDFRSGPATFIILFHKKHVHVFLELKTKNLNQHYPRETMILIIGRA
jgi:hypothetical protein